MQRDIERRNTIENQCKQINGLWFFAQLPIYIFQNNFNKTKRKKKKITEKHKK